MKPLLFIALFIMLALAFVGCEVDRSKAQELLQAEGCSSTVLDSWAFSGCSRDDNESIKFSCVRNGLPVHGVICGQYGFFAKGYTIRWK